MHLLHVLMSLAQLGPGSYPKLFSAARLNATGETSLLFGCLALALFAIPALARSAAARRTGYLAWPGGMPPITLLCSIAFLAPLPFRSGAYKSA